MDARNPRPRRTCTSCRKWFDPKPSAVKTQKACSAACRAERCAMLARRRRERHLQESRVAERERQRACRKRRLSGAEMVPGPALSRATLSPQVIELRKEILS